jgi:2-polyprenyl-6-methoxyphenol hydroxylase-like FAD-dependent oxidoreductase
VADQSTPLAIIGGGVGGLVLSRVLQQGGRDVVVFEREASADARGQGGVLDLDPESGQWALQKAGLEQEFLFLARPEGQDRAILDKTGEVLWSEITPPGTMDRPESDLLLGSLRPGTVRWGHQLASVEAAEGWRHRLRFANGAMVTAKLVVGADGARSQVRPLLTDARPAYTGGRLHRDRHPRRGSRPP